ncbi:MAG: hypothetical protein KatS3mg022_3406 [Armatimonadota bacterium]|nr:MAG: hypothetical protein KatS3mg022_3406 [Armatimonadota bacterium]
MSRRMARLVAFWFILAVFATWVAATNARETTTPTSVGITPQQVYGDACPNTCPPLDECSEWWYEGRYSYDCCRWDWGCWLNPREPNYQLKLCTRGHFTCRWYDYPGGGYILIRCCDEGASCQEVNGWPCCHPLNNVICP